jgi:uncharacterized protein
MSPDEAIEALAQAAQDLPREAMQWSIDHWDEAGPRFIALLERYASGADRSDGATAALFFVIHLLGEMAETEAFPSLCTLMRQEQPLEDALGDAITETLTGVVISTFNDDLDALKAVIEAEDADQFVRLGTLQALAYITRIGKCSDGDMRAYLLHLFDHMQPQAECVAWAGWADAVSNLGYEDYAAKAEQLIRRGFVPLGLMTVRDFRSDLRRTLDDPERMAGFARGRIGPFVDAIGTLEHWYDFTAEAKAAEARPAASLVEGEDEIEDEPGGYVLAAPHVNPLRHVGRNDPCPCGSGKKYKKCCIDKPAAERAFQPEG